eukprot:gene8041-1275_t
MRRVPSGPLLMKPGHGVVEGGRDPWPMAVTISGSQVSSQVQYSSKHVHSLACVQSRKFVAPPAFQQTAVERRRAQLSVSSSALASSSDPAAPAMFIEDKFEDPIHQHPDNPATHVKATGRIVAIGDVHGDWQKTIDSLLMARVIEINEEDEIVWSGGDAVLVQVGDVMDRGDNEIAIVKLLRALDLQAKQQGGAVHMLNGNHESLNVCGDFRYVTPGAFVESALFAGLSENELSDWGLLARVRYAVYKPGGPMALELAKNPTVLVVNDTAFAHGGLLPIHVNYGLKRLNAETAAWMRADTTAEGGKAAPPFLAMGDSNSVFWNRELSKETFPSPYDRYNACNKLKQALAKVGAKRLVVGHTPQVGGANCECEGQVWRIDVGMSSGVLNRATQVLEIVPSTVAGGQPVIRVIREEDYDPSFGF